jgi:endonuclease/exonuclease/phosphatase family metal-dependent hydrolase
MATKYRRRHEEAWRYLLDELQPDVALVQEALFTGEPRVAAAGQLIWSDDRGRDSGTAIFVRGGLNAAGVSLRSTGSYIAAVELATEDGPTLVASVHVGPPNYRKHLRILADELSAAVAERRFVVGGDLNAARCIDKVYKGRWFTRYFDDLERRHFYDCHWRQHGREIQSFWGRQAKNPYQCDHLFVDAATGRTRPRCQIIDNPAVREFSDHGPMVLVTRTPTSVGAV